MPDGATVTIAGVLTTALGALESGHGGFVQDASGGIALYLDGAVAGSWPAGSDDHGRGFAIESVFTANAAGLGGGSQPGSDRPTFRRRPFSPTGAAGEAAEGRRVFAIGTVVGSPDQLADGLAITIDDGSGPLRAVIGPDALGGQAIASGMLGDGDRPARSARQLRDGHRRLPDPGDARWRARARDAGADAHTDAHAERRPSRRPPASATPTPTPACRHRPPRRRHCRPATPTATPAPTPSPDPGRSDRHVAERDPSPSARHARADDRAWSSPSPDVSGRRPCWRSATQTAGSSFAARRDWASLARGTRLEVAGKLAAPYGQLEIRPTEADVRVLGTGALPAPRSLGAAALVEADEGRLVTTTGRLDAKPTKSAAGDITLDPRSATVARRSRSWPTSRAGSTLGAFKVGATYRIVGFVGQRATRTGALDGYRIWIRDAADLVLVSAPSGSSASGSRVRPGPPGRSRR